MMTELIRRPPLVEIWVRWQPSDTSLAFRQATRLRRHMDWPMFVFSASTSRGAAIVVVTTEDAAHDVRDTVGRICAGHM